jgi:hypothetical protein
VLDIIISIFPATKRHLFHKTLIMQTLSFPLYAAVAWYFGAPKYPKRFVNPTMGLLHNPTRIKKTVALRFVFDIP